MSDVLSGLAIKRISTADQIASLLKERILQGEIRPGTPLREVVLANSIGVSRNTLREALRILIQEGLVRHTVHRGITVTQLDPESVGDIYKVRRVLELAAVETSHPSKEILERLGEAADCVEQAAEARDWLTLVEADMRFHRLLVSLLGSDRLDAFFGNLVSELRLGLVMVDRTTADAPRLSSEHRKVQRLLVAGKKKECALLLTNHLQEAERLLRAIVAREAPSKD
jgi:DNA-binding GntR family transcriptional regulator